MSPAHLAEHAEAARIALDLAERQAAHLRYITVTNLGKAYKQYPTRWSWLAEWALPGKTSSHNLKRMLKQGVQP